MLAGGRRGGGAGEVEGSAGSLLIEPIRSLQQRVSVLLHIVRPIRGRQIVPGGLCDHRPDTARVCMHQCVILIRKLFFFQVFSPFRIIGAS